MVAGESPGTLMVTTAADHAFLTAMVADIGGTNANMNMNMDMVMNMDMAIAVGDFRGFGPLFFFETYVRDVALRDLALHRHRPLSLRRIANR